MSRFFTFNQNNSGGHFDNDEAKGIGEYVIIEATDADDARQRAESIGLYFNGVNDGRDCSCCGDRWYGPYGEGTDKPTIYGKDATKYKSMWGLDTYIHYMNDKIKKVKGAS